MLIILIIFTILLFIGALWFKKFGIIKLKGFYGEMEVARALGKTKKGKQYVIHNLLFADKNGNTCEIDYIYINQYGIWVIEMKNRKGKIYGTAEDQYWTQFLTYKKKYSFYNPIRQNDGHIQKLSSYLGTQPVFHNIICFSDKANLSSINAYNVYNVSQLPQIKTAWTGIQLSTETMENYYNRLLRLKENSTVTKRQHIKNIKKRKRK